MQATTDSTLEEDTKVEDDIVECVGIDQQPTATKTVSAVLFACVSL